MTRIVLYVKAGALQYRAADEDVTVILLDGDTNDNGGIEIDWGDETETCWATMLSPDTIDPDYVDGLYQQVEADEGRRGHD